MKSVAILALIGFVVACSDPKDYEDYGDIKNSPGGLALSDPDEHRGGWGRSDCLLCHNVEKNIHRRSSSTVDPDAIADKARQEGTQFCFNCHMGNGVPQ